MPGFSINGAGRGPNANVQPAFSHRWLFEFDQIGTMKGVALYAMSTQRPSVEIDTVKLHLGQTEIYMPGKHRWSPINVKFYELIDGLPDGDTTAREIFVYWAKNVNSAVILLAQGRINPNFRATCSISLQDGLGESKHTYSLSNVWPIKIEPSELTYATGEISTVQVTLRYDAAFEQGSSGGGGGDPSGLPPWTSGPSYTPPR